MSFGTGSESGLDRGAFWRFGTLRQHSLGWQGAGAWPRGGCQGCDGDVWLEPWEYWLGLQNMHLLTLKQKYELRVDLEDFENNTAFAKYADFSISPNAVSAEEDGYTLYVSGFEDGGAGDSLTYHSGQKFSTFDRDQDLFVQNCAALSSGAFWFRSCHFANLNGFYLGGSHLSYANGINWAQWKGFYYSLKRTEMKIRRA